MLIGMLTASVAIFLGIGLICNIGITLYMIPFYILEFAKECWEYDSRFMKAVAIVCFAIGWPLHYLVRIIWHGFFFALGTGISFLITSSIIRGCLKG